MDTDIEVVLGMVFAILVSSTLLAVLISGGKNTADAVQLARIEKKLDLLLQNAEIEIPVPTVPVGVDELLMTGNKIGAIKRYRELNPGMGLKEAKDAVEEYARSKGL
jgi:ribosomal protein L7/L12